MRWQDQDIRRWRDSPVQPQDHGRYHQPKRSRVSVSYPSGFGLITDRYSATTSCYACWHPSGKYFAVPMRTNGMSADQVSFLPGGPLMGPMSVL